MILFWAAAGSVCTALINPVVGACVAVGSGAFVALAEVRFTTLPHPDKGEVPVLLLVTIDP